MGPVLNVRISGVRVRAGLMTPVMLAVIAGGISSLLERGRSAEIACGILLFSTFVAIMLLHETLRIAIYRRIGVTVRGLDLLLTGGNPSLIDRSASPRDDVIAGIGGLTALIVLASTSLTIEQVMQGQGTHDIVKIVAVGAIAIAILQAMPALPFDGGRLLRGLFWYLTDSPVSGSRVCAAYGHLVAIGLLVGGTLLLSTSGALPYWGFGAVVLGFQMTMASWSSYRDSRWQAAGRTLDLADANLPLPGRIAADVSVEKVVDALIEEGDRSVLLVVDGANMPIGILSLPNLRSVARSRWSEVPADCVMTPLSDLPCLSADMKVLDALSELDRLGARYAVVDDPTCHQVTLVLRDQLANLSVDDSGRLT